MTSRSVGSLTVSAIGLGCMNMSSGYGRGDDHVSRRLLNEALDVGYTFFDTATLYGGGHNETLVGDALGSRRSEFVLASKCGLSEVNGKSIIDGRPETLRLQCENSLKRLKTDVIDLYYLHRLDPDVPIEDSVGELGRMVADGKVREIGLSEVSVDTLTRAHHAHPIAAVQSEFSLWSRTPEFGILEACRKLETAFVAFSPLGRQFLTGKAVDVSHLSPDDIRATAARPRFEPEVFAQNTKLLTPFGDIANSLGLTMAQLSLAWLLAYPKASDNLSLIPIPGTKHIEFMNENWGAVTATMSPDVFNALDNLINENTVEGNRYSDARMMDTDSEQDRLRRA